MKCYYIRKKENEKKPKSEKYHETAIIFCSLNSVFRKFNDFSIDRPYFTTVKHYFPFLCKGQGKGKKKQPATRFRLPDIFNTFLYGVLRSKDVDSEK